VFGYSTRLITSLCQEYSGYLLSFAYTLIQSLLLSLYLSVGYLPSLSSMAARLGSCLPSDTLSYSSRRLGLYRCSADRIRDTLRQGSIARVRQSVASETSHLIRCYDLSLWELNNFHCSCFHGSISLNTLQYV
jgi:hypothetical protein